MRILICFGTMYSANLGIGALTASAVSLLEQAAARMGIKNEYVFLGSNSNEFHEDSLVIGNTTIPYKFIPFTKYASLKTIIFKDYRKLVNECDFVIDLSEGDGFTDIYGMRRFVKFVISSKLVPILSKKKFIMMPQTIGPFKKPFTRWLANRVMKGVSVIYARDKQSKDYLDKHISGKQNSEIIDIAFALPFQKRIKTSSTVEVGINVSGLLWNGGYTKNNQFGLKSDYQPLIEDAIKYFIKQGASVTLVGHVFADQKPVEDDQLVNFKLKEKYPEINVGPKFKSPVEAKSFISGFDYFIGARMHACIAAFSSGVPTVPIAYSRKFNGMFVDTLKYNYITDAVNEDNATILSKIKQNFEMRGTLAEAVQNSHLIIKSKLNFLIDDLVKHMSANKK